MKKITYDKYYYDSLIFSEQEKRLCSLYTDWLPDKIIDCHAHCNTDDHIIVVANSLYNHINSTFLDFDLNKSRIVKNNLFPGKEVYTLRFSHPMVGINHKEANNYLLTCSPSTDGVALCGVPTDIDYTIKAMKDVRVKALKMYHAYFDPPALAIYDFFKPEILETAQAIGIPVILHLPRPIFLMKNELRTLLQDFPGLRVVLAHLGLPISLDYRLKEVYLFFSQFENLYMDTSMITSLEVMRFALKSFGAEKILYGTDEPLNLLRGKMHYDSDSGLFRFITNYPYHWVNQKELLKYIEVTKQSIIMHWQILNAIKSSVEDLYPRNTSYAKERIFYRNAKILFRF